MKPPVLLLIFACSAMSAMAGEYAVLASGARLYAERHESDGGKVTLFTKTGSTEMDASLVVHFEKEEYRPPHQEHASPPAGLSPTAKPASIAELVDNAARKYGLPPAFVAARVAAGPGYEGHAAS